MGDVFDPDQVVDRVGPLSIERLRYFEQIGVIVPVHTDGGRKYRTLDVRRLILLCELTDDFELNEDGLVIVMSLLDQLQGANSKLERITSAIVREPLETQQRLSERLCGYSDSLQHP